MNDPLLTLRVELKIPEQKVLHHLQSYNTEIEEQAERALAEAFKELADEDAFYQQLKEAIKITISYEFKSVINKWNVKQRISKMLEEKLTSKLDDYAQVISETLLGNL